MGKEGQLWLTDPLESKVEGGDTKAPSPLALARGRVARGGDRKGKGSSRFARFLLRGGGCKGEGGKGEGGTVFFGRGVCKREGNMNGTALLFAQKEYDYNKAHCKRDMTPFGVS